MISDWGLLYMRRQNFSRSLPCRIVTHITSTAYCGSAVKRRTDDGQRNDVTGTQHHGTTSTQFVEYQSFVQTIRERANTENSVLKAEIESLKTEPLFLRTRG